jgi:putative endonuclease
MFFVYMLESEVNGDFYKGMTSDVSKRLAEHNEGKSRFTKALVPWKLVYVQFFATRGEALAEERRLKRCNKVYLRWLIDQPVNKIKQI